MLTGFRVLDLTSELGLLCGKILGDLGADVIKIEKPGGDTARRRGPYYKGMVDPEKSLFWYALNANKRGITLDLESHDGREILRRLVEKSDCVIESFPVGYMKTLGLDYERLRETNKRLIMTSVSPFGQEGPYAAYKPSDLVCMAMGGFLYLCGEPDRPPVGISLPHAYFFGGADGAAATMIAYYHREKSGEGQWIDVSIQQSAALTSFNSVPWWQLEKTVQKRNAPFRKVGLAGGLNLRQTWPCKDGFVVFILTAGAFGAKNNLALTEWMKEEGMAPEFMTKMDWNRFDAAKLTSEFAKEFEQHVGKFFSRHTMSELYDGAFQKDMQLYPVSDCRALAENIQLKERGFWEQVEHPDLGASLTYPGGWAKMSGADCRIRFCAPLIGQHNREIYQGELGLSANEMSTLKQAGII
ncbi:MAG: CoA transferase [Desulfobacterales bacterium]|nr:CoA transferase [Desulfobacterales bacterium]